MQRKINRNILPKYTYFEKIIKIGHEIKTNLFSHTLLAHIILEDYLKFGLTALGLTMFTAYESQ